MLEAMPFIQTLLVLLLRFRPVRHARFCRLAAAPRLLRTQIPKSGMGVGCGIDRFQVVRLDQWISNIERLTEIDGPRFIMTGLELRLCQLHVGCSYIHLIHPAALSRPNNCGLG